MFIKDRHQIKSERISYPILVSLFCVLQKVKAAHFPSLLPSIIKARNTAVVLSRQILAFAMSLSLTVGLSALFVFLTDVIFI